jgi:hypothetical protein
VKSISWISPLLLIAFSLSVSQAQTPTNIQTPDLIRADAVTLTDQHSGQIEYKMIDAANSISLQNCSNIIIYCCDLHSITLSGCTDISVQNCWIHDSAQNGIDASGCKNLSVEGCRFEKVASGLWIVQSSAIRFIGNYAGNMVGPYPRGQMVQFDKASGGGNVVANNYCVNFQGQSHPEDDISMYESEGQPDSPILIEDNYLMGDPVKGSAGKSPSGSGIMLGDNGGRYILCQKNVVIDAGQVGIGVAGGDSIKVEDNIVIGSKSDVSNVGISAWNQSKSPGGTIGFSGNRAYWINKDGEHNGWWQGPGFVKVDLQANLFDDPTLIAQTPPPPPTQAPLPPGPILREGVVQLPYDCSADAQ